jgi:hypothetical protein
MGEANKISGVIKAINPTPSFDQFKKDLESKRK